MEWPRRGTTRTAVRRLVPALLLVLLAFVTSACAEARVHYTFEEDGAFRVEGSVVLTQRDAASEQRLVRLREQLDRVGLTTADLTEPGRLGFTFRGDSADNTWAQQQAGGGPRLWTDQGLLRKKYVFFWPLDWKTYVEGVAPEGLDEYEAASFQAADLQVTASFPGEDVRHNGALGAGDGSGTVTWTLAPLEPRSMRAEYSFLIWWRVALVPVLVVATLVALLVLRYRSLRDVPRVGEGLPPLPLPPRAPSPARPAAGPPSPTRPPPRPPTPSRPPATPDVAFAPAPAADAAGGTTACPVCDAPVVPGEPCARCVATAEGAGGG